MDHYADIEVRPDPEFPAHQLMSALYAKLHRALVAQKSPGIGVSFPGVDAQAPYLGTRLRLHASLAALSALLQSDWLAGMRDHVALTPPEPVPPVVQHRAVRRVQVKSSPERLRRRLMRRHGIDEQQARQRIPDESARLAHLPFVQLRSTSTGQSFRLFIDHGPVQPGAVPGDFNAYGLSQGATIPWF
ncbi:MAG: type I-F CRISPR-associated endoribonuclease Cas6/Csy4 [Burkholderiaceae bacterium]|nr:type I-F CRISPR-associated endoribonuclease Cas6/Csy4 [Burkholderiaceae bacterium]